MATQKKIKIEGILSSNELDSIFDMALIYSANGIVYLRNDTKEIQDVVVGDELLGWRGEFRKVTFVYRPKIFLPMMLRYGVGAQIVIKERNYPCYLEIGEGTKLAGRNFFPNYDPVTTPIKIRDLNIHSNAIEVCESNERGSWYKPSEILKLVQKRVDSFVPYLIGIEGSYLVVNNIVVAGCDGEKIKSFIEKEKKHDEQRIKKETRNDVIKTERLRNNPEDGESFFSEDESGDDF